MKQSLFAILKGRFLVSADASRNWKFILFFSALATAMIASSHAADRKVHQIAALSDQVRELRSEFVETRSRVQQLKLESAIRQRVQEVGLLPAQTPPRKLIVTPTE
ncbi:FtsL-like putative cell division protein [Robiginitalea sp. M366]|uniref:FtsL-like putative cell division protein n=1 Tax=Robiginitalea aestuariiviva TaxID=3036903 RepID=UPI00240E8206|nr:FtsL-like putative cell division protein [Robiginitalea aestuariiviva]MDG1570864.1 FtsL-like putative cell division protein [Robiginitalea aestuariiviva]